MVSDALFSNIAQEFWDDRCIITVAVVVRTDSPM